MNKIARKSRDGTRIQTIDEHLLNTANIAANDLRDVNLEALGTFVGISHDIGKLSDEFGDYIERGDPQERGSVNHSSVGALYIYHKFYKSADAMRDTVGKLTAQIAINAIYCHHMSLYDCISPKPENVFQNNMDKNEKCSFEEIMEMFFSAIMGRNDYDELFDRARSEVADFVKKASKFKMFGIGMLQKMVYSALIDADRYDAYCFESETEPKMQQKADWVSMREKLDARLSKFRNERQIDKMRSFISEQCRQAAARGAGIYRLSVPTGAGKTLASLRFALNAANDNRHIFYVVPYTTILDQTYEEFMEICGAENVIEHHSGVIVDDNYESHQIYTERWTAPVILTTFVQFMNALYAGKSSCARRMRGLFNSVIILDEVQSMPREVISLFNEAINFLVEICGCTALLCTATQPALDSVNHPIRLAKNSEIVTRTDNDYRIAFKRTQAVNMYSSVGMSCEEIAEFARGKLDENRSILIVMNTVSEALRVYEHLEGDFKKIYLSTKKCRATRMIDIRRIKEHTKKLCDGKTDEKLIVVSTQLVEAGVDISFECAIRALAGIDNLVQTAGRSGRNGEFGHVCNVYSINVKDENLSRLKDIEKAKRCSIRVLSEMDKNADIMSPECIAMYYREYFKTDKHSLDPMDYICGKTTIMDMLSDNKKYASEYANIHPQEELPVLKQAFRTAGEKFSVIKSETESVIVPCDDTVKKYISVLTGYNGVKEKADVLKRCNDYVVNLFGYDMQKLRDKNAVYFAEDVGVWILSEGFYNDEYGILTDGELEFWMC